MFTYCLNNPSNMSDAEGTVAVPIGALIEAVAIYACAVFIVVIISSPQIPKDISRILNSVHEQITVQAKSSVYSSHSKANRSIPDGLGKIAGSAKEFTCDSTAKAMADYLKKHKKQGYIVTITYSGVRDFIWSDMKNKTISYTGVHVGVEYNGIVYCVVHPYGLPENQWINDFQGTGKRTITKIAI